MKNPAIWRALLAALSCFAIASAWRILGERQEAASRGDFVRQMLDAGKLTIADGQSAHLEADFAELDWTRRLHSITATLVETNTLLQQRHPAQARARVEALAKEPDAPAVAHLLLGQALIQLGERAAGEAEKQRARELAPDSPLFRNAAQKDAPGRG